MLLYDFELIEPKKPASGDPSVTHLRLHFDERFALAPITDSTQTQTQEFATLEEVRSHMQREGIRCRYVFASECAYGMGFDESFFKELIQR
ncbi:MAG: hypothetical protein H6970_13715 [Gammaproteobacteria bacterium]|nr:hypothetical protein [Gammaproteobacteria bacterium]MCP5426105.1 hypothetical protein [Gammaproteobacteria bacterium]